MRYLLLGLLLLVPSAFAEEDAVLLAYHTGNYGEAAELAEAEGGAANLALAAEALLSDMFCQNQTTPAGLDRAVALSRQAIALDPSNTNAHFQLAVSRALQARSMSVGEGRSVVKEVQSEIDIVLDDWTGHAPAEAVLAVANLEAVRKAGAMMASFAGFSVEDGRAHYERAMAASPDDPSIHWQYGRALVALDARKYHDEIDRVLARAEAAPANNKVQTVMKERAKRLRALIASEGDRAAEAAVASLL